MQKKGFERTKQPKPTMLTLLHAMPAVMMAMVVLF